MQSDPRLESDPRLRGAAGGTGGHAGLGNSGGAGGMGELAKGMGQDGAGQAAAPSSGFAMADEDEAAKVRPGCERALPHATRRPI